LPNHRKNPQQQWRSFSLEGFSALSELKPELLAGLALDDSSMMVVLQINVIQ